MTRLLAAFCTAFAMLVTGQAADAQGRERIGYGWLATNDIFGDLHDRWQTGSVSTSRIWGPGWTGRLPQGFGEVLELRFGGRVVAPQNLNTPAPGDRPFGGALSLGLHTHFARGEMDYAVGVDVVVTGPLDGLLHFAPGKVAMRADWVEARRGRPTGHGSVFRFDPARHGWLYEVLAGDAKAQVEKARGSEQRYTSALAQERGQFAYLPGEEVVSFKHDCLGLPPVNWLRPARLPEAAKVVCFHGHPKMHEAVEGWSGSWLRYCKPTPWLQAHWIDRAREDLGAEWA